MKRSYRITGLLFGLLLVVLLPVLVFAAGSNKLHIYKINNRAVHSLLEKPEGAPVQGAIYRIWRVDDVDRTTDQAGYDRALRDLAKFSIAELDAEYSDPAVKESAPTDADGKTTYADLPDGRYYVQEVEHTATGWTASKYSTPFLVDLPYLLNGVLLTEVSAHPKGYTPTEPPEEPEEPTGGEKFIKVDDKGTGLEGARFKVVVRVKDEAGNDKKDAAGNYLYEAVQKDGKDIVLASDAQGRFEVTGLPYGIYWLVETVSPPGYTLLKEPLEFFVTKTSYDDVTIIRIVNKKPDEPGTEPPGTEPPVTEPPTTEPPPVTEPPDTEKPTPPPSTEPKPPGPKPPGKIVVPETGDVEIFFFLIAGVAMVVLGLWIVRDTKGSRPN